MKKIFVVGVLMTLLSTAWAMPGPWGDFVRPWIAYRGKPAAVEEKTPTDAIRELDKMLGEYHTGAHLTAAHSEQNRQIKQRVIHGTFDIRELCRISLGRHWTTLSDADRERFVGLMTDLLEEKGVLSKEQGQKKTRTGSVYQLSYRGQRYLDPIKSRALVRTQVFVPSHNVRVTLDYKLRRNSVQWKIYDVIVDGSSLVENYQYQFDNIITKYGYAELVSRVERKLAEFRAQRTQ